MKIRNYLKKREWGLALLALLSIVTQVFFDLKLPDYMARITSIITAEGSSKSEMVGPGLLMMGCALGSMFAAAVTGYCMAVIGTTLARRLRKAVFDKTFDFSMGEISKFSTASLITRCTNDVTQVQMFTVMGLQIAIKSPILAVWAILKISGKNLNWTLATAVAVVVLVLIMATIIALVMPRMIKMQRITDDLNRVTREHLTGIRVIRAYNSQGLHAQRFEKTNDELTSTNMFVMRSFAFMMPVMSFFMSGLSLSIYVLGAVMIDKAEVQNKFPLFSDMVVFSSYAIQVMVAFVMLSFVFVMMPRAVVALRRIREVVDTPLSIRDGVARAGRADSLGCVEFKGVDFRFPDAEADALHEVNFKVEPGQTLAIIGATGSGKSAIVNLIPRFYDVSEGQVLVDGRDVREWNLEALRNRISMVTQRAVLFSGTVASNIKFGRGSHEVEAVDVVGAARIANASEFIGAKEDGYASSVAQGGSNFSGGQKQRLSIARAVARDGSIMIFDDSFSALDYKTDRDVRAALRETSAHATLIIVSQRIGTVMGADRILVVDEGRIVGSGTHSQLLESCGVYQEIALSQLSEEELA